MFLKRLKLVFLLALISLICLYSPAFASSYDELAKDRLINLWIDGQVLGDMVIGARSQLSLIFMDRKACEAARSNMAGIPDWISWNLQYESVAAKDKKKLFLIRYKTFKNWEFDVSKLSVGDYILSDSDILTRRDFTQTGSLPPGTDGTLAVAIPSSKLKPGSTVSISYGENSQSWTIPKR